MNVTFRNSRRYAGPFAPFAIALMATCGFFASPAFGQDDKSDKPSDSPSKMENQDKESKPGDGKRRGKKKWLQSPDGSGENQEGRRPEQGKRGNPGDRLMQMLDQIDKDGNGTIEKTEAPERMLARFDQIDTSGDEKIDKDEVQAMMEKMAERMRQGKRDGMPGDAPAAGKKRKRGDALKDKQDPEGGSVDPVRPGSDDGDGR